MGKGEWCVWRSRSELSKESNQESHDALCQLELGLGATIAQEIQIPGDFKMAVKLRRGAQGNAETADELTRSAERVSFNDVRGYRYRRSTDLIAEPEVTTEGFPEGEPVGRARQRVRALPGLKGGELLHRGNLVVRLGSRDIAVVQVGAQKRISVIPFPVPYSPFPGV